VITGYNTDIKHRDRVFHVQTEDKGAANPVIESLIYTGGKIIASRQYSYAWLMREEYTEKAVQGLVDSQHRKMMRDIRGGKYDPEGPPPFGAGIITERGFDELVMEFLEQAVSEERMEILLSEVPPLRAGELVVLGLSLRTTVSGRPVGGAQVEVRALADAGKKPVILFEGASGQDGSVRAGVEIPREAAGGRLRIEAVGPLGSVETSLEVPGP